MDLMSIWDLNLFLIYILLNPKTLKFLANSLFKHVIRLIWLQSKFIT